MGKIHFPLLNLPNANIDLLLLCSHCVEPLTMAELNVGATFSEVARMLGEQTDEMNTLLAGVAVAVEIIEGCDQAGITLKSGGRESEVPVTTSEVVRRGDRLQFELNQGPCLDALRTEEVVVCHDLANETRWPEWAPIAVAELGIRSFMAFRLFTSAKSLGALSLSSHRLDAFDNDDIYLGFTLAAHVAVALAACREIQRRDREILDRTAVGQAEGILMERYKITPSEAFDILRGVSRSRHVKLVKIAADLVRTGNTPIGRRALLSEA